MDPNYDEHEQRFSTPPQEPKQVTYVNGLGFLPETPQQAEHKALTIQYNILLFSTLLLFFLRAVSFAPIVNLLSLCGLDIVINPLTNVVTMSIVSAQMVEILTNAVYLGLPALVILLFNRRMGGVGRFLSKPNVGTTRYSVLILLGTGIMAYLLSRIFVGVLQAGGVILLQDQAQPPANLGAFVLYFVSSALVPAFLEEILFRGAVLHAMRRFGDIIAIAVSTVLYTLVQPSVDKMVYAFIMGLALSYFTVRSGSIWSPIAASVTLKSLFIVLSLLNVYFPEDFAAKVFCLIAAGLLLLALFLFTWFVRNDDLAFQIYSEDTYLTNRAKIKTFVSNFGFWMVVVLAFLYIVPYIQIIG